MFNAFTLPIITKSMRIPSNSWAVACLPLLHFKYFMLGRDGMSCLHQEKHVLALIGYRQEGSEYELTQHSAGIELHKLSKYFVHEMAVPISHRPSKHS